MDVGIKDKLLAGLPIEVDGICEIMPLILREIAKCGYDKYDMYLRNLIVDPKDILKRGIDIDISGLTTFDIIASNIIYCAQSQDTEYVNLICNALSLFLKTNVNLFVDEQSKNIDICFCFETNEEIKIINRDNYENIKHVLLEQNCIDKNKKEEFNPANKKAEEIAAKMIKGRSASQGKELSFLDLVSVLAANGNGLNILNVWDLTFYQFNDQFNRMKMIEDYDIGVRQLLAGAKKEDVNLKYYVRPID